jgi:hypothetical protein
MELGTFKQIGEDQRLAELNVCHNLVEALLWVTILIISHSLTMASLHSQIQGLPWKLACGSMAMWGLFTVIAQRTMMKSKKLGGKYRKKAWVAKANRGRLGLHLETMNSLRNGSHFDSHGPLNYCTLIGLAMFDPTLIGQVRNGSLW